MKKSNTTLVVLLLIGIILVSGCVKSNAEKQAERYSFVGGNTGLEMGFMANQPPVEIYEDQIFTVAIDVENKGEADVSGAKIILEGVDTEAFGIYHLKDSERIEQATQEIVGLVGVKKIGDSTVPGGRTIVVYTGKGKTVEADTPPMTLRATVLYPYKTTGIALVCLKENIYAQATGGSEICKLIGEKTVESSGAPVQVTYVEELPTGFNIKIENKGRGIPFVDSDDTPTTADKPGDLGFGEINKVGISAKIGNGAIPVNCAQTQLMLTDKKAETFCAADLGRAAAEHTDILTITLNYGYMESINKDIRVIDMPTLSAPA